MNAALVAAVRRRARGRCEYCRLPESESLVKHVVDHIRAQKHRGGDDLDNLALACLLCNMHKGADITGYDPETNQLSMLFNPRSDRWRDHFRWDGVRILGLTAVGRTTAAVLQLNEPRQITARTALLRSGWLPQVDLKAAVS